ncbi:MAG: hypothetical protein IH888_06760 [Planctomycetes bacterium]|nr:hypothetical protein [Planctomycetota bacterium]
MRRSSTLCVLLLGVVVAGCGGESPPRSPAPMAWHSGGTLQNATLAQWQAASDHNRLATCSMLVIDALMQQGVAPNEMDIAEIKPWAIKLQACISEASGRGDAQDTRIAEIADGCLEEMDF